MTRLQHGRNPDMTVGSLVRANTEFFRSWPLILVTSIDSTTAVCEMSWVKARFGEMQASRGLLLSGVQFSSIVETEEIFFGFDEIWLCDDTPHKDPPPDGYLVCPRDFGIEEVPESLRKWISDGSVVAGFGDGFGLNYISKRADLLAQLSVEPIGA